jgi:hypothetical protein
MVENTEGYGEWMRRIRLLVASPIFAVGMLVTSAVPASAQGYTGWIEHPYPSAGLWYCNWYSDGYWCQDEGGTWLRTNPDWYDQAYNEMMRVYGVGAL